MVFDGPAAKLPIARLRPSAPRARRRALVGDLDRWLSARWAWVRPRTVPLLAAFLGLLVTLGAVKYVAVFAYQENLALDVHSRTSRRLPPPPPACGAREPVQIIVAPIAQGDPYIELMIDAESR